MESRNAQLHIRLTHKELAAIQSLRDETGQSYSQLLRAFLALNNDPKELRAIVFDRKTAPMLEREMRKWGHHYNQAVHALNRLAFYAERDNP